MADTGTMTKPEEPTYSIGETTYRLEALSWKQHKWLADHVFKGIDMHRLDYATVHDLLREKGPLMMAICLLAAGTTRAQHSRLTIEAIRQRADDFAAELTGGEVTVFGIHFFRSCLGSPATMALFTTGKGMQQAFDEMANHPDEKPSPAPGASGSSAASSPSAAATLPSSEPSSPSGDQPSLIPISGAASSERPSTAPCLASAG